MAGGSPPAPGLPVTGPASREGYDPRVCFGEWQCAKRYDAMMLSWQARTASHPLVARVYATDGWRGLRLQPRDDGTANLGPFMTALLGLRAGATAETPLVLVLGEVHDNSDHHAARALMLNAIGPDSRPRVGVVAEQVRADQQPALDQFQASARPAGAEGVAALKTALSWETSGWNKYAYEPVLAAILAQGLTLSAGDPPRQTIKHLAKEGRAGLDAGEAARLALDRELGSALDAASFAEIKDSHCGMLPETAVPRMAFAQRYRDAHLADATLRTASATGAAILLTGNIHARRDRGVPWYLTQRQPGATVISVLFVEVEAGQSDPSAYVPRDPDGKPAADFVVFTPRAERGDPCAAFKAPAAPAP